MAKIDRHFVSEFDKKMAKFNRTHPKTASQQFESEKYKRIYQLRDEKQSPSDKAETTLWD